MNCLQWVGSVLLLSLAPSASAQSANCSPVNLDLAGVQFAIQALESASYPELARVNLHTGSFHSDADYFRTRFSLTRFFLALPMRYSIQVNPALFGKQPPPDGVCAILAHELAHVVSLSHGNRLRRLALVRLLSGGYTAKFERRTDLEAIHRGYAEGLKQYRIWVYSNVPAGKVAEKRRRYFSPEEIDAISKRLREQPTMLSYWRKHPPLSLEDVSRGQP